jgi:hypothetical protein
MNREQIIDFVQQTQVMLQQLGEMQKNLNQGKAIKDVLTAQGEMERALKMASELKAAGDTYDKSTQALFRKCKRSTVQECETLLGDIVERLKLADAAFDTWRALLASNELEIQLDPNPETRSRREADIADTQKRYEAALAIATQTVPSPGVVLL